MNDKVFDPTTSSGIFERDVDFTHRFFDDIDNDDGIERINQDLNIIQKIIQEKKNEEQTTQLVRPTPEDGFRIMITGAARSGKDTMADMIQEKFDETYRIGFADELKRVSAQAVNYAMAGLRVKGWKSLNSTSLEEINKHRDMMRTMWQWLGTDIVRDCDDEHWIKVVTSKINKRISSKYIVIPDCRFSNEHHWGLMNGFVIVRIRRKESGNVRQHSSENSWDVLKAHLEYNNDGSLEDMHYWIMDTLIPYAILWSS